jgi:uroporphyrinogen-III synthase
MVLLVTRPEPQASSWVEQLQQAGVPSLALPLIAITAPPQPDSVIRLWHELAAHRALMFVSPASVDGFFGLRPDGTFWPPTTLATAPGPGTAQALLHHGTPAGLSAAQIVSPPSNAEQFDSEALWPLLQPLGWRSSLVAIVSGGDASGAQGRAWLSERWREAGARVQTVQAYQRGPGTWTAQQEQWVRDALPRQESTWLLSSSQALDFLLDHHLPRLSGVSWKAEQLQILCTHPRIASHATQRGIHRVRCCAPTVASVVQARRQPP